MGLRTNPQMREMIEKSIENQSEANIVKKLVTEILPEPIKDGEKENYEFFLSGNLGRIQNEYGDIFSQQGEVVKAAMQEGRLKLYIVPDLDEVQVGATLDVGSGPVILYIKMPIKENTLMWGLNMYGVNFPNGDQMINQARERGTEISIDDLFGS